MESGLTLHWKYLAGASAGPWVNGILRDDALAAHRNYHLSHLALEETEARRNKMHVMNGAIFSSIYVCQGGGRLGWQEGFTSVLQTTLCGQLASLFMSEHGSVERCF